MSTACHWEIFCLSMYFLFKHHVGQLWHNTEISIYIIDNNDNDDDDDDDDDDNDDDDRLTK